MVAILVAPPQNADPWTPQLSTETADRQPRRLQLNQHQQKEALARRDAGEPVTEIARSYDVHHATISRLQSWQSRLAMIEPLRQKGRQT
jgi:DNA invertase Pin-like site-specific DNA recombinase